MVKDASALFIGSEQLELDHTQNWSYITRLALSDRRVGKKEVLFRHGRFLDTERSLSVCLIRDMNPTF